MLNSKLFWPGLLGTLAMATTYWQVFEVLLGGSVPIHYSLYLCLYLLLLPVADWLVKQAQK